MTLVIKMNSIHKITLKIQFLNTHIQELMRNIFLLLIFISTTISSNGQQFNYAHDNPLELGKVNWIRNYDEALKKAEIDNKPVFILFQEVPGCGNCTKYGKDILSHPLIVEAIEDEFIPLAIYNNKKGHDREVLNHFGEPTWNNPVVRFTNPNGGLVGKRIAEFRSTSQLLEAMISVLNNEKRKVPTYLSLLAEENRAVEKGTDEFFLSMYCFWTGEKEIAKLDGVIGTEAGFMHGNEVVKVKYDRTQTDMKKISQKAVQVNCGDKIFTDEKAKTNLPTQKIGKYHKDSQDKYYLLHSPLRAIPMTEYQKMKVNSALGSRKDPSQYLSPRQLKLSSKENNTANFIEEEFVTSWYTAVGER